MYLFLRHPTREIIGFNETMSKEAAKKYQNAVEFNGDYPYEPEKRDGYKTVLYLEDDDKTIRIEYEEVQKPEPTQLDRIEEKLSKTQKEIAESAVDAYTLELLESGVL